MSEKKKKSPFVINKERSKQRRLTHTRSDCNITSPNPDSPEIQTETGVTTEQTEIRQVLTEMAQSFISTIDYYKSDWGGAKPHDEAVKEALQMNGGGAMSRA